MACPNHQWAQADMGVNVKGKLKKRCPKCGEKMKKDK